MSATSTTDARGAAKKFGIATLSFAKHNNLKLSNAQVAELTRANVPSAKTTAGSVADYVHKLNTGLYDFLTLEQATTALDAFDKGGEFTPFGEEFTPFGEEFTPFGEEFTPSNETQN